MNFEHLIQFSLQQPTELNVAASIVYQKVSLLRETSGVTKTFNGIYAIIDGGGVHWELIATRAGDFRRSPQSTAAVGTENKLMLFST